MTTIDLDAIQRRYDNAQVFVRAQDSIELVRSVNDVPSLLSLVRELQASIPARVVLDGDPEVIEAALDALPDRAVVTSESLIAFDMFLKQPMVSTRRSAWYQAGVSKPFDAGFLARNYSPLVVLR